MATVSGVVRISIKVLQEAMSEVEDRIRLLNDLNRVFISRIGKEKPFTLDEMETIQGYLNVPKPMSDSVFRYLLRGSFPLSVE